MSERRLYVHFSPRTSPRQHLDVEAGPAGEQDVPAVVDLVRTVAHGTPESWPDKLLRDVREPGRVLLVARSGGAVVGHARLGLVTDADPAGWYLVGLVVAEAWRRRGVGEALVLAACAHVPAEVVRSTYDAENLASAALHESLGFTEVRRGRVGFPGQAPGSDRVLVERPPA